jgi:hypothetical protein
MIIYLDYFVDSIGSEFSDLLLSTAIRHFFKIYLWDAWHWYMEVGVQ